MGKDYKGKCLRRQSNFELLRIIAMLMIIAHHFCVHGGFDYDVSDLSTNRFWIDIFSMGGKIGVNIYVIISGYFLINNTRIKKERIIKLWSQMLLFSVSLLLFSFFFTKSMEFANTNGFLFELVQSFFPVITRVWWFASAYFILYCFTPLINKFIKSLDKRTFQIMLIGMTLIWCIVPSITVSQWVVESNQLLWFFYLYCLVGYYRIYGLSAKRSKRKSRTWFFWAFAVFLFTALSIVILSFLGTKIHFFEDKSRHFLHEQSLTLLLISIFLFLGFERININSKIINEIASTTFGIYLIHDYRYMSEFLWKDIFNVASFQYSNYLIPYSIVVVLIVFVCCGIIEYIFKFTFERAIYKIVSITIPQVTSIISF